MFKENFKALRELYYTQQEIAERLNVSRTTVSHWESGISEPSLTTLVAISKEFNVSTDFLLGLKEYNLQTNENAKLENYLKDCIKVYKTHIRK